MTISLKNGKFLSLSERVLLQIICAHKNPVSKSQLHKFVFIFQKKGLDPQFRFKKWFSGVYSDELDEDLNQLLRFGFIKESTSFWMQRKLIYVDKSSFNDLEILNEDILNIIHKNEIKFSKLGIYEYTRKFNLDFNIENFETGSIIL